MALEHPTHFRGPVVASGGIISDPNGAKMLRDAPIVALEAMEHRVQALSPQTAGPHTGSVTNPYVAAGYTPFELALTSVTAFESGVDGLKLQVSATDNSASEIYAPRPFLPAASKPISFFARVKTTDISASEIFLGISNASGTALSAGAENFDDFIGFIKTSATAMNTCTFCVIGSSSNSNPVTLPLPFTLADDTLYDFGFRVHSVGTGSLVEVFIGQVGGKPSQNLHQVITVSASELTLLTTAALVNGLGLYAGTAAAGTGNTAGLWLRALTAHQPYAT